MYDLGQFMIPKVVYTSDRLFLMGGMNSSSKQVLDGVLEVDVVSKPPNMRVRK